MPDRRSCARPALLQALACLWAGGVAPLAAQDATAPADTLDTIEVIGTTPLHGVGLPKNRVPANVQSANARDIEKSGTLDLSEYMNRNLGSVFVNQAQNSPLQPDVQYRGFTASPLLGLPQGLAVYQDGVRVNEPFGDTVNWDLIPDSAIASINLMPGSNPVFGLNTLGGALSIATKNGFTHPGVRGEAYLGSWERTVVEGEIGGSRGDVSYFVTAQYFDEEGWRDFSPSTATQAFGNLGWRGTDTTLDLSVTLGDSELVGNGPAPIQLLAQDREAIYTAPDRTENDLTMVNLRGTHFLGDELVLDGNLFYRGNDTDTLNGDDSDYEACEEPANLGFLCEVEDGEEEIVEDENGDPVAFSEALEGAVINTTTTSNDAWGGALQATYLGAIGAQENQLVIGAAADGSRSRFRSRTELGTLDGDRVAVGGGVLVGDAFTDVKSNRRNFGLFFTDTLSITPELALTLAGRYNRSEVELRDQLGTALDGDHTFERFNPAAGLTYLARPGLTLYGSYSESSRAPTPVELTCADPEDPCRLPNAFLSDPPLDQVVAKTWEGGLRGQLGATAWNLGLFRATNHDDILFISAGALTGQGYFDNVGNTRRQGVELNLQGSWQRLDWRVAYTYLDATFRTPLTIASANHPDAVDGEIEVETGDRLPGIPEHLFKLSGDYRLTDRLSIGADVRYASSQVLRGDESNQLPEVDGYTVVDLRLDYRVHRNVAAFLRVDNLFDTEYETFGVLGEADEVLGDEFDDPRFLSPGSPRGVWGGIRLNF